MATPKKITTKPKKITTKPKKNAALKKITTKPKKNAALKKNLAIIGASVAGAVTLAGLFKYIKKRRELELEKNILNNQYGPNDLTIEDLERNPEILKDFGSRTDIKYQEQDNARLRNKIKEDKRDTLVIKENRSTKLPGDIMNEIFNLLPKNERIRLQDAAPRSIQYKDAKNPILNAIAGDDISQFKVEYYNPRNKFSHRELFYAAFEFRSIKILKFLYKLDQNIDNGMKEIMVDPYSYSDKEVTTELQKWIINVLNLTVS